MRALRKYILFILLIDLSVMANETTNVHIEAKQREAGSAAVKSLSAPLHCADPASTLEGLKQNHPLVLKKEVPNLRTYSLVEPLESESSIWLAHALACKELKTEEVLKYLDEEAPNQLMGKELYSVIPKKGWSFKNDYGWTYIPLEATYDNREMFLKPKELASVYEILMKQVPAGSELGIALAEQLLEFAHARKVKRDAFLTENLKGIALKIGKKLKSGKLDEVTEEERFLIGLFTQGKPAVADKIFGSLVSAKYRDLLLEGEELKQSKSGDARFSMNSASPNYLLSGDGILPDRLKSSLSHLTDIEVRNSLVDKSLFWKDPKDTLHKELAELGQPQKQQLRDWARERFFALKDGSVAGGDALTKEAFAQILGALDHGVSYADITTSLNGNYRNRENDLVTRELNQFSAQLLSNFGLELNETNRLQFFSLGKVEREALLELTKTSHPELTSKLKLLLSDLNITSVINLMQENAGTRKVYFDKLANGLKLAPEIKAQVDTVISDLITADPDQNEQTIAKANPVYSKFIEQLKISLSHGAKDADNAESLSRLINLIDEIGLTDEQKAPLDATRDAIGVSHYAAPITLKRLEAEGNALLEVHNELARNRRNMEIELEQLVTELYPKGMSVPSHTRALLGQLLLPEHAAHLSMLRRLKIISDTRDGIMLEPIYREVGRDFRKLMVTPTPMAIEAMLKKLSPNAYTMFIQTQGEPLKQELIKSIALDPIRFHLTMKKLSEGKELDETKGGEGDIAAQLVTLTAIELLKGKGQLNQIVDNSIVTELAGTPDFALQMNQLVQSLYLEVAPMLERGEGIPELAKMPVDKRKVYAAMVRRNVGDIPESVTNQQIIENLNEYNQVGKKVRSEIEMLLGSPAAISQLDLNIGNTLDETVDRQLRRLNLDLSQKQWLYEKAYQELELSRTEHRRVGKEEWDKQVRAALGSYAWEDIDEETDERRNKNPLYWLVGFSSHLRSRKNDVTRTRKQAEDALALVDTTRAESLDKLRRGLLEMETAYFSDLQDNMGLNEEDLKKHEETLRKKLVDSYVAQISLPHALDEKEKEELKKKADAFLSSHWKQQTQLLTEQSKMDQRVGEFIQRSFGEELANITNPEDRAAQELAYYNRITKILEEAAGAKARSQLLVTGLKDTFGTISADLTGSKPVSQKAFETLATQLKENDLNTPGKLSSLTVNYIDEHLQADLDKIADPKERAQQKAFLASELEKRLSYLVRFGNSARMDVQTLSEEDPYYQRLLSQHEASLTSGQIAGYHPDQKSVEQQRSKALDKQFQSQYKEDRKVYQALWQLQDLGLGFDGTTVTLDTNSSAHWAHLPTWLVPKDVRTDLRKAGWKECELVDTGGDEEMRKKCVTTPYQKPTDTGGDAQFLKALQTVNDAGIALKINHPEYQEVSLSGKRTMEDFMTTLFNKVNRGKDTYLFPMGKNDAVRIHVDRNTGRMTYELRTREGLSRRLEECLKEVEKRRDLHQLATERNASVFSALNSVMSGGEESWQSKQMGTAYNKYVDAINACMGYGTITTRSGVSGQDFEDQEESELNHQIALQRQSIQQFEGNLNMIEDTAWMTIATIATFGVINPGIQALTTTAKAGLTAETAAGLTWGQKMFYLAGQSNKVKKGLTLGLNVLERVPAATAAYRNKFIEGAAWSAVPLVPIYGWENLKQEWAYQQANQLYREGKFTKEKSGLSKEEWVELVDRTDRNNNGIPDSLDRMGKVRILPNVASTANSLAGGGEFFGGMSAFHTLFPKLPGVSYFSVFAGSMNSNVRDIIHGRKTFGESLKESAAGTLGMAPGLAFMNNAQYIYNLPGMKTKIFGKFGPTLGRVTNTAGIHYLNKAGHYITGGHAEDAASSDSVSDQIAYWTNEVIGWKFAKDMSATPKLRSMARDLGKQGGYEAMVKEHGKDAVDQAIHLMTPKELFHSNDAKLFNRAAETVGKSPKQLKVMLDISLNGGKATFFKEMGIDNLQIADAGKPKSYLEQAFAKLKEMPGATRTVLDGTQGWTHDWVGLESQMKSAVVQAYQKTADSKVREKLTDYLAENQRFLKEVAAKDLPFTAETEKTDAYLLDNLANASLYTSTFTPYSQGPKALNSGVTVNGKFYNIYGVVFARYVRAKVKDASAQDRTIGQLLENYQQSLNQGRFSEILDYVNATNTPKRVSQNKK